jgi:hypothetical protein
VYRPILIISLLVYSSLALSGNELIDYLKQYEGRWLGDFTIHSTASAHSETFPVEQRYWWEDGQLHGISVSNTNNGLQTAKSRTFIQDEKLQSEVITGEITERFFGFLRDGGIVWISTDMKRANDYQMAEHFAIEEGSQLLLTEGFDSYVYSEGLAHLVCRGRLFKQDSKSTGN